MWSLTSQREKRTSSPENFQSSAKKDFFNTICQQATLYSSVAHFLRCRPPRQASTRPSLHPLRTGRQPPVLQTTCPEACGFDGAASTFERSCFSRRACGSAPFLGGVFTLIFLQVLSSPTS